jgi:hypothetical protein
MCPPFGGLRVKEELAPFRSWNEALWVTLLDRFLPDVQLLTWLDQEVPRFAMKKAG